MPVSTAGLAEIGAGDPQPLVIGRGRQHPLEQLSVRGLERGALLEPAPPLGDLGRECIADGLQLSQPERSRLPRAGGHTGVDPEARERLRHDPCEL
jgi:hypothetical protein